MQQIHINYMFLFNAMEKSIFCHFAEQARIARFYFSKLLLSIFTIHICQCIPNSDVHISLEL